MDKDQAVLQQLKWAVQALAAEPELQLGLFPNFVCKPDELVLDFDNWKQATVPRKRLGITRHQLESLNVVELRIEDMPPEVFTEEHIRTDAKWELLRQAAKSCLSAFGWPHELPPEGRSTYVPAG